MQSANPNSDYDMCHVASPPASCASICGPGGIWCDFAGWTCTWDDTYFLQSKLSKGDEYSFEKNTEGDWLSDADEQEAYGVCYGVAFSKCLSTPGMTAGLCFAAIDDSDMELEWHDVHCLYRVGNTCVLRGG